MQYFAIVLVSPETSEIAQEVARLMEPYELYRPVQPYKEAVPQEEINFLATCFELDPKHLEVMLAEVRAASSFECWIEGGVMFWMTTDNPEGHWDTCRIWTVQDNVWPVPNTPEDFTPIAVITPDGVWHDLGYEFIRTDDERSASFAQSRREAQEFLAQCPASRLVVLGCHR
jgi:hypothetical protein